MARNKGGYNMPGLSFLQKNQIIQYAKARLVEALTDRQCRRLEWIYFCLLMEKHLFTREQLHELDAQAAAMVEEYQQDVARNGQEKADEHLRKRVSLHWGEELDFGYPGNPDKTTPLREAESRIY